MRAASSGLAVAGVLAVQFGQRALDRQRRPCRALGVVLMRHRITEQRHQPVAQFLGDMTAHFGDRRRGGVEVCADEIAPLLGIKLRRNAGRADQIAEHHREIAAFTGRPGSIDRQRRGWWSGRRLCRSRVALDSRAVVERGNGL